MIPEKEEKKKKKKKREEKKEKAVLRRVKIVKGSDAMKQQFM